VLGIACPRLCRLALESMGTWKMRQRAALSDLFRAVREAAGQNEQALAVGTWKRRHCNGMALQTYRLCWVEYDLRCVSRRRMRKTAMDDVVEA
jgi:hypothetical protein